MSVLVGWIDKNRLPGQLAIYLKPKFILFFNASYAKDSLFVVNKKLRNCPRD